MILVIKIGLKGPVFAFVRAVTATRETAVPCECIVIQDILMWKDKNVVYVPDRTRSLQTAWKAISERSR